MSTITITRAAEAKQIANELIAEVHQHLRTARILYLFTTQHSKNHDKVVLGKTQKLSAMLRFLSSALEFENESVEDGFDFIITFDVAEWKDLTDAQRRALVDHELCHCAVSDTGWRVRAHDVEEFRAVIERHGFWKYDLKAFGETAQQLPLIEPERGLDDGTTVTVSALGESVTVTGKQFSDIANGIGRKQ